MTDLTLSRTAPAASSVALTQLLKEMFSATPLGLVLAVLRAR